MSECWSSIKVKDLGTIITGKTPPTKDKHNFGKGYPFIKPPDLSENTRTIKETETEITEDGLSILPEKLIPPKSTCVVCIGSIGKKIGLTSLPSVTNSHALNNPEAKYPCGNMPETELLKKISDDLDFLKTKILEIEESFELIDSRLHPVREEYIERLDEIKKEGTISGSEFEKKFGVKL